MSEETILVPKERFEKLCDDVCDVKTALVGNAEFKQPGIIEKVEDLLKWKNDVMLRAAFLSGIVSCAAFLIKRFLTGSW